MMVILVRSAFFSPMWTRLPGGSPALRDRRWLILAILNLIFSGIGLGIEFAPQARSLHDPHLAEHGMAGPGAVVLAEAPGNPGEPVGIAAVELIFIVKVERNPERVFGGAGPLDDPLPPVHPHIIVHLAGQDHLLLSGVPVGVSRPRPLELGGGKESPPPRFLWFPQGFFVPC